MSDRSEGREILRGAYESKGGSVSSYKPPVRLEVAAGLVDAATSVQVRREGFRHKAREFLYHQ
jgi:hypothetical protein